MSRTTQVQVDATSDVAAFLAAARPVLDRDPVASNVIATNAAAVLAGRSTPREPRWFVVRDGALLLGAAMQTHPYPLWVGPMHRGTGGDGDMGDHSERAGDGDEPGTADAAAQALVGQYARHGWSTEGVNGSLPEAEAFAHRWEQHADVRANLTMQQLMYELVELTPPTGVPGAGRLAVDSDIALLTQWMDSFHRDVGEGHVVEDLGELVRERVAARNFLVWEVDGRPVSLAGTQPPSVGVARVGPVYTPPAERGHGYAAAATAAVSQQAFDLGAQRCMLFTDAANPTSNAVYRRLGYTLAGEAVRYRFTDQPST